MTRLHPMPRRAVLSLAALIGLGAPRPGQAQQDTGRAAAFIQATGTELVAAINDPRLSLPARRDAVGAVLRKSVDIDGVGRFILGRWWRQATPPQQQEYMRLFEETLIRNLSARFGEYRGVRFELGRIQQRTEDDVLVNTIIERPNTPAIALDWRVSEVGGQPKIVDVIAEGTSLRLTQRSEYSSVIQRSGGQVGALLDAMRQQVQQLAAREGRS